MTEETKEEMTAEVQEEMVQYTCHPITRLSIGNEWLFDHGIMTIPASKVEAFEKDLEGADARTRYQVHKIDALAAEAVVQQLIQTGATKSIDSTAGGDFARGTEVGTTAIDAPEVDSSVPAAGGEKLAGPLTLAGLK